MKTFLIPVFVLIGIAIFAVLSILFIACCGLGALGLQKIFSRKTLDPLDYFT